MSTISVKLTYRTRQVLRLIAAYTDETIQELMERLAESEWKKVQEKSNEQVKSDSQPESV